jgi:2-methylisocitrate lyase-like PEP mutase family enzyme
MNSFSERRRRFRALLKSDRTIPAVGVYDALSALLVQKAGFPLAYVGSYASASSQGIPDVGLMTMEELTAAVRSVVNAVDIPVIADAENGFYQPANIWRAVRQYEGIGVAAIHIDDHESGKHSNLARRILPLDDMLHRIRAAQDARTDPDFMIIARTDAAWASGKVEDAVARMIAFAEAGAEAVFATGINAAQLASVRSAIPVPVIHLHSQPETLEQETAAGVQVSIYHAFCLYAAAHGVSQALERFRQTGSLSDVAGYLHDEHAVESLLDYEGFNSRGVRYGMA